MYRCVEFAIEERGEVGERLSTVSFGRLGMREPSDWHSKVAVYRVDGSGWSDFECGYVRLNICVLRRLSSHDSVGEEVSDHSAALSKVLQRTL